MKKTTIAVAASASLFLSSAVMADCTDLPNHADLTAALQTALAESNGGLDFDMWATVVDSDGTVCAVTKADAVAGAGDSPWRGSRVISAQKANTADEFSTDGFALSTANLFSAVQPGGSLFGLQHSNPVDTDVAYGGDAADYGTVSDPMVGGKIGGVNVFGGGLPLYTEVEGEYTLVGAIGVSGDTSCADHNVAWKTRVALGFVPVPAGVNNGTDNIIYDINPTNPGKSGFESVASASGFGHPTCLGTEDEIAATF